MITAKLASVAVPMAAQAAASVAQTPTKPKPSAFEPGAAIATSPLRAAGGSLLAVAGVASAEDDAISADDDGAADEASDDELIGISDEDELIGISDVTGKLVVIVDVFRATSCFATALACGIEALIPVATLEECQQLGTCGHLTAAERDGHKADGFDLGNSPFSYQNPELKGRTVAVTTTNGTQASRKGVLSLQTLLDELGEAVRTAFGNAAWAGLTSLNRGGQKLADQVAEASFLGPRASLQAGLERGFEKDLGTR